MWCTHRQLIPHLQTGAVQQGLLHDAGAGCQHLPEGSSRFQGNPAVKGIARRNHLQPGQHRCLFIRRTHHAVEFVNPGPSRSAADPPAGQWPAAGGGNGVIGSDDNVSGVQGAGVIEQGTATLRENPEKAVRVVRERATQSTNRPDCLDERRTWRRMVGRWRMAAILSGVRL
jgi:hypothetical protein